MGDMFTPSKQVILSKRTTEEVTMSRLQVLGEIELVVMAVGTLRESVARTLERDMTTSGAERLARASELLAQAAATLQQAQERV